MGADNEIFFPIMEDNTSKFYSIPSLVVEENNGYKIRQTHNYQKSTNKPKEIKTNQTPSKH